ncbi:calmodulin-like isoform X2 [Pyrus communis]|uniref:calmodulin-like isoform X2 n=1 Tax=Pyrus communis TaxID=23211 RepID=UPI0035C10DA8
MPKRRLSDSDVEETSENSSAESEDAGKPINGGKNPAGAVSEYEKRRLSRIAENRARMEALGLPKIASSLMGSGPNAKKKKEQKKGKAKVLEDDEDYRPDEDQEGPSSSGSREEEAMEEDDDDDFVTVKTKSGSRGKKAISLSLQGSHVKNANVTGRKGNPQIQEDTGRRKRKNSFASRLQMTEDELILHFFQFDEKCDGGISIADVQRLATTHDFMWNKEELADMIHCFDSDGDGKLSLEEFRKIVVRCNMIKEPEQS